ncbi:hypothetical protein RIF23_02170 [Lipingzhangella sp. LS1_29]|uniref:Transcriptional regulator n=1 Tax=Lipingzhangella rawalii TaxID=2055835 RepID=A0ABU2H1A6_9ACTN|nr:hypothetical protein [Lipingzhangella rawalii]
MAKLGASLRTRELANLTGEHLADTAHATQTSIAHIRTPRPATNQRKPQ